MNRDAASRSTVNLGCGGLTVFVILSEHSRTRSFNRKENKLRKRKEKGNQKRVTPLIQTT